MVQTSFNCRSINARGSQLKGLQMCRKSPGTSHSELQEHFPQTHSPWSGPGINQKRFVGTLTRTQITPFLERTLACGSRKL